jgi:pyruvate formate lyase activating enzyme
VICNSCGRSDVIIAKALGLCRDCIAEGGDEALRAAAETHKRSRASFPVPAEIPHAEGGLECRRCANECRIPDGGLGFCGLRRAESGRLTGGNARDGYVHWYKDPLPTNCVADWVCPAGTGAGYPDYAYAEGPEIGFFNLAVFYYGCTFNCLFCQNWQCKGVDAAGRPASADSLAAAAGDEVSCICYFGGDPTPQIHHALAASRLARRARGGRILRICWETNGAMSPELLNRIVDISLESGGCVKFDIKAWDESLHKALTGVGNKRTLKNVDLIAARIGARPEPPLFVASTLMVPGYVDAEEVGKIARFLAERSPGIPYSLLAFAPQFVMRDLTTTSRAQAGRCRQAALEAGLTRVRIGNQHLLW